MHTRSLSLTVAVVGCCLTLLGTAHAQLVWTGNVNNAWDLASSNWLSGATSAAYTDGADVAFNDRTLQPTVNITRVVSPNSVSLSNSTSHILTFTNFVIGGAAALTKDGNGTVRFGNGPALMVYSNSFPFTGGTTVKNGTLGYYVSNTSDLAKATGGVPFGFGTGPVTFTASAATLSFAGWQGSCQLTNNVEVTGGGILDLARFDVNQSSQNNVAGNIALRSTNAFLIKASFTAYGDPKANRFFGGVTTLYTNGTLAFYNSQYQLRSLAYEQNITAADPSYSLRLNGQGVSPIELSGNNTGVVAGVTLLPYNAYATAPILFLSTNAMGGGVLNVSSGAYAGLQFAIPAGIFSRMAFDAGAALGLETNTAIAIDLSTGGINRDIWLGSMKGAVYTGTLTPYGSSYRFGGGGCIDQSPVNGSTLILASTNALSGSRSVVLGDPGSFLQPGMLALAASNNFTGGILLNGSRSAGITGSSPLANPTLISRAQGALGTGPVAINRTSAVGNVPTLQFEVVAQTVGNDILITNSFSAAAINAAVPTILRGNLTSTGASNLNIQAAATATSLLVFDQTSAGHAVSMGSGSLINQSYGLFDPITAANLPTVAGYRMDTGATLVLSPGFTWANLIAGRTWVNSSTPVGAQWTGRNFAGRGTTQIIDGTGAFQTGTATNWLDSNTLLGSAVTNADGTFYANAGVKIARDFTVTGDRAVTVASTGPGVTNASTSGIVHEIAGTISGPGLLRMLGTGTGTDGQVPELVLSGTSVWSGSVNLDYQSSQRIITGPGGLGIVQANPGAFLRFNGNASIPTNNGGVSAYLVAIGRSYSSDRYGFLLSGAAGGMIYTLQPGYRFLLGGSTRAVLGSSSGGATLADAMVTIWHATSATTAQSLTLLARDADAVLMLGSSTGSVRFSSGYCAGNSTGAGLQAAGTAATALTERPALNTLIKRGPGTLVLQNVKYTMLDGSSDNTTNFTWQVGGAVAGQFDGVVRETGTGASNSLRAATYIMNGGLLGLAADYAGTMGTNSGRANMSGVAGAGFAAYGARRVVTLTPQSGGSLNWGQTDATKADFFMNGSAPLILNAPDADAEIVLALAASTNTIDLRSTPHEIRVLDNPGSTVDRAVVTGRLTGSGGSLSKSGAGTLVMTASNDWSGVTWVSNGTLLVNGVLAGNSPSNVTVCSGATLGGTGRVLRAVNVLAGGALTAGEGGVGTLTVSNLTLQSGASASFVLGATGASASVNVLSNLTLAGTLNITFTNQPASGKVFNLFDWGSRSGTFDAVAIAGAVRPERVNLDRLYTAGEVSIRPPAGTAVVFW